MTKCGMNRGGFDSVAYVCSRWSFRQEIEFLGALGLATSFSIKIAYSSTNDDSGVGGRPAGRLAPCLPIMSRPASETCVAAVMPSVGRPKLHAQIFVMLLAAPFEQYASQTSVEGGGRGSQVRVRLDSPLGVDHAPHSM